jgi:hypothetical protein
MFLIYLVLILILLGVVSVKQYLEAHRCFNQVFPLIVKDDENVTAIRTRSPASRQISFFASGRTVVLQWSLVWLRRHLKISHSDDESPFNLSIIRRVSLVVFFVGLSVSYLCAPLGFAVVLLSLIYPLLIVQLQPSGVRLVDFQGFRQRKNSPDLLDELGDSKFGFSLRPGDIRLIKEGLQVEGRSGWMPVIWAVLISAVLAIVQRSFEQNIHYEGFFIFPLYLALPVVFGRLYGRYQGMQMGILSFVAVFTMAYPFPALEALADHPELPTSIFTTIAYGALASGSGAFPPHIALQYLAIPLGLAAVGYLSGLLSSTRWGWSVFPLSALLWAVVAALFRPAALIELDFYSQLAASMAWAIVAVVLLGGLTKSADGQDVMNGNEQDARTLINLPQKEPGVHG